METLQIIPIVMIITGAVKGLMPKEYIQLFAVLVGLGLALAFNQDVNAVLSGVLGGIGAVGTYSVSKGVSKEGADVVASLKELIK